LVFFFSALQLFKAKVSLPGQPDPILHVEKVEGFEANEAHQVFSGAELGLVFHRDKGVRQGVGREGEMGVVVKAFFDY